jgi:UDP-N-acetylmuramyl pentapeptide phosphotransferase/UDP-N-acetylglucosamine-1-phosphate transferase
LLIAAVISVLPDSLRVVPALPWWIERALLLIGGLWFVNLVNFMDGIDWMIVVEVVPIAAALTIIGYMGALPAQGLALALALGGALAGFAYFNRPVAKLFLGDVGSLPIGLALGWLLLLVAAGGHLTAALIMPLYFLADTAITLLWRLSRGEPFLQAHRTHFYQFATDRGFSVIAVVSRVFAVNLGLCALALATVAYPGRLSDVAALIAALALVTWLLFVFTRDRK